MSDGSTLDVATPPGITDGQVLRLRGKGAPGSGKGGFGDALIEIEIKPDRFFTRQGEDVYLELPVTLTEAVHGARINAVAFHRPPWSLVRVREKVSSWMFDPKR